MVCLPAFTIEINVTGEKNIPAPWIPWVILQTQTVHPKSPLHLHCLILPQHGYISAMDPDWGVYTLFSWEFKVSPPMPPPQEMSP